MIKYNPNDDFLEGLVGFGLNIEKIIDKEAESTLSPIFAKFCAKRRKDRLFGVMSNCVGVTYLLEFDVLYDFYPEGSVYVFFEIVYGGDVFVVNSLRTAIDIYDNYCPACSMYISDVTHQFLLSITEEDSIVGSGIAADWLEAKFYEKKIKFSKPL